MEDDWDLHAVVRGRTAAATTTTTTDASAAATTDNNPFPSFSTTPFNDDQNSFDNFPGLIDERDDPFQGLQEIYREFCVDPPPPPATTSAAGVTPPAGHDFQREIVQIQSVPVQMRQENMQFRINNPSIGSSSQNFPAAVNPQPIRQRRRKNQQMKMVRQMTQEELSTDSWAWRKYGQKPIKGSPYPRNYYRCSTSKGCAARKQVERSPTDPAIFVVSYSGEHTHPRPAHRSSLAGSTRSKFSPPPTAAAAAPSNTTGNAPLLQKGSSPASGSSFSPTTPLAEGEAAAQNDDAEMAEEDDITAGEQEEEENIIMIQNDLMNDDEGVFKGFQDSDHSSGGGDFFSSSMLSSPPWTPTSSATNTANFSGGGGG